VFGTPDKTLALVVDILLLKLINNSSSLKKEIMTVTVFGYLILISKEFYDFISPFSL